MVLQVWRSVRDCPCGTAPLNSEDPMAKFLSQVYTAIRGSVGGVCYTANKYANLMARSRVTPTQPNTTSQTRLRAAFSEASYNWKNTTDEIRAGWDQYAQSCPYSGPLGNYYVDGRTLFMGIYTLAAYLNGLFSLPTTPGTTVPVASGWLSMSFGEVTVPTSGIGFKIPIINLNDEDIVLESVRSRPNSPTRLTWHGPYVTSTLNAEVIVGEGNGDVEYTDLSLGKVYFVRVRMICDDAPLRISQEYVIRAVAVAAV